MCSGSNKVCIRPPGSLILAQHLTVQCGFKYGIQPVAGQWSHFFWEEVPPSSPTGSPRGCRICYPGVLPFGRHKSSSIQVVKNRGYLA